MNTVASTAEQIKPTTMSRLQPITERPLQLSRETRKWLADARRRQESLPIVQLGTWLERRGNLYRIEGRTSWMAIDELQSILGDIEDAIDAHGTD